MSQGRMAPSAAMIILLLLAVASIADAAKLTKCQKKYKHKKNKYILVKNTAELMVRDAPGLA
jgi:hypothetical protein